MTQGTLNPTSEASSLRPLDRSNRPAIPAAVADLWEGWGYHGDGSDPVQVKAALDGITNIVCALAGDRYAVSLQDGGTAWTDLSAKRAAITAAALRDGRLTLDEALAVTTAMAVHEGGHGRVSGPMTKAVEREWKGAYNSAEAQMAHRLSNIIDDVRLEADTVARWSAYDGLFDIALWWVAQRYPTGRIERLPTSKAEAVNLCTAAVRYLHHTTWDESNAALIAERAWWADWGQRAAQQQRPIDHVRAIREALARMADLPDYSEVPTPPLAQPTDGSDDDEQDAQDGQQQPQAGMPSPDSDEGDDEPQDAAGEAQDDADAEDEADAAGADGDEAEDGEPLDAAGLPGQAGEQSADDADERADEQAEKQQASPTQSADGTPGDENASLSEDDGSSTEGDEVTYRINEDEGGDQSIEGADSSESDDQVYTQTDSPDNFRGTDTDSMGDNEAADLYERDALADPLPAHATDAVTRDDRDRDIDLSHGIGRIVTDDSGEMISVTHLGGSKGREDDPNEAQTHTVEVGVVRLTTDRERISTSPAIQNALAAAFTSRKTSHDTREVGRSGRISGSRLHRIAYGSTSVYTRREGLSADRLDLHLLVDASGSMAGSDYTAYGGKAKPRVVMAAQMAANITEALTRLGTARVHVWAHNTGHGTTLWDVFDSQRGDALAQIAGITTDGANNDASAIAALTHKVVEGRKQREQSIIVVISDGAPCESEAWVRGAADEAREQGIGVVSVAISGGLSRTQEACYGADDVVAWTGDWDSLAERLAEIVGRLA